jgi:hypothetical protein
MLPYTVIVLKVAALVWLENREDGTGTPPKP